MRIIETESGRLTRPVGTVTFYAVEYPAGIQHEKRGEMCYQRGTRHRDSHTHCVPVAFATRQERDAWVEKSGAKSITDCCEPGSRRKISLRTETPHGWSAPYFIQIALRNAIVGLGRI